MSALSDYLQKRADDEGLSIRAFARRCDVAIETARRLLRGTAQPDEDTLKKVADKLPAPLTVLQRLAGIPDSDLGPFELPTEFDQLDHAERRVVVAVGRQLLASSGKLSRQAERDASSTADDSENAPVITLPTRVEESERPRVTRAARKRPKPTSGESEDPNGR